MTEGDQMHSGPYRRLWLATTSTLALFTAGLDAAKAQDAATTTTTTTNSGQEEVTVTARRRSEALQDVPAAVTVLDAQTIQDAGVHTFEDVARLTPNLSFNDGFRKGVSVLSLRGVTTSQGGEPPVTIIVDGVQVPGLDFLNQTLVDIDNIQILRGPQGATYGRGAIAGAIVVTTTKPLNEVEGKLDLTYGSDDTYRATATGSGAIIPDKFWIRLAVSNAYSGGYIYDPTIHHDFDFSRERSGHIELLGKPDQYTTVDLRLAHTTGEDGASPQEAVTDAQIYNYSILPTENLKTTDTRTIDQDSLKLDRDTPWGTFTSVTGYGYSDSVVQGDADFGPLPIARQYNTVAVRAFNEDLRFSSPTDMDFQWLAGAFFQRRDTVNHLIVDSQPNGLLPPGLLLANSDQDDSSTAWAGYGQASYKLPWAFEIEGALRFDSDERYTNDRVVPGSSQTHTFYALQPQITLSHKFADDILGYFTYGRGFRSGGYNAYEDALNVPGVQRLFPKETIDNYEIGAKTQFFDKKLTLNLAAFHDDFTNQQFFFVNASPPSRDIVTLPSTTINGGELEATYRPIHQLTLTAGVGVNDTTINDAGQGSLYVGNRSPLSYDYTANLGIEYRQPIFRSIEGMVRLDYQKLGNIYYDQTGKFSYDPVNYVNMRVGVEGSFWTLSVFAKNLTDQRAPNIFSPNANGADANFRLANQPRTFGVEITSSF